MILDLYNSIVGDRPTRVVSFGGRNNFIPSEAPPGNEHDDVYQIKTILTGRVLKIHLQVTRILSIIRTRYWNIRVMSVFHFHTSLNVPDEQRRFCIIGSRGMAEGDFGRGGLRITDARTGKCLEDHDFSYPSDT